jgi:hypothetical protein
MSKREVRSDRVMESGAVKGEYFLAYQSTEQDRQGLRVEGVVVSAT